MKKVLGFLMFVLVLSAIISSCKKDKTEEPALVTQEKWFLAKSIAHIFNSEGVVVDTVSDSTYTANDYLAFQTNNQFEWITDGEKINGTYKIENSILYLANQTGSLQAAIEQKSATSFIFFWDQLSGTQKVRITLYYKP
jgi:hypothetical protein